MKLFLLISLCFVPSLHLFGSSLQLDWYEIEKYLEESYSGNELSTALDILEYYSSHPINLHTSDSYKIAVLPTIDLVTAKTIKRRITLNPEASYNLLLDSLPISSVQKVIIYNMTTNEKPKEKAISEDVDFYARLRHDSRGEETNGFKNNKFAGSSLDLNQLYNLSYGNFDAMMMANKNAGEKDLLELTKFAVSYNSDFISATIGDFAVTSALGNLFWNSFVSGKGADIVGSALVYSGSVRRSSSTINMSSFRGLACSKDISIGKMNHLSITAFYGNTDRDATIDTSKNIVTSIYNTGLFRTATEIKKQNSLNELAFASIVEFKNEDFSFGLSALNLNYDKTIQSSSGSAFKGKNGTFISFFGSRNFEEQSFAAEITRDNNANLGLKASWLMRRTVYSVSAQFRYYDSAFRTPFGYNFGEQSFAANEIGLYVAMDYRLASGALLEVYTDLYSTIGRTYTVQDRVIGLDLLAQISFDFLGGQMLVRDKFEVKTEGVKLLGNTKQTIFALSKENFRCEWEKSVSKDFSFRLRADAVYMQFQNVLPAELGLALMGECKYSPTKWINLKGRATLFSTDSYNSAIWMYEYRLASSASAPALYDDGMRSLLSVNFDPIRNISFSFAWTRLTRFDAKSIGSSYDEISGNTDNRFYMLLEIKL